MNVYKDNIVPDYLEEKKVPFDVNDLNIIPISELNYKGICSDHLNSGNEFVNNGLKTIIEKGFNLQFEMNNERNRTPEDEKISKIFFTVSFENVTMSPPSKVSYQLGTEIMVTPKMCLLQDLTYAFSCYVDIVVDIVAHLHDNTKIEKKTVVRKILIANIPAMVHSSICNIKNKSLETLQRLEEDPSDPGGYYIINGIEWVINSIESSTYNKPKIFYNKGHKNEVAYLEMISKPGDGFENSSQVFIKMLNDDRLVFIIDRPTANLNEIQIPFYILLRYLGWSSDRKIVDWIVGNYNTNISKYIVNKLNLAFKAKYPGFTDSNSLYIKDDILRSLRRNMHNAFPYLSNPDKNIIKYVNNKIIWAIDNYLLPHIGISATDRNKKAIFLSYLIKKLILVEMKAVPSTDRDSLNNKRAHSAGISLAKAFKQQFNFVIVQMIKKNLKRVFKLNSFSKVNVEQTIKTSVNSTDASRALAQAITTGSKQQIKLKMGRKMVNRLTSNQLHRKNHLNFISSMREIKNSNSSSSRQSKQSSRANEMRRVHPTFVGYICPIQTQDGESVGINKQTAISASITSSSSSELLKNIISNDNNFIEIDNISWYMTDKLPKILINGDWIGCIKDNKSYMFVDKYRHMRRNGKIHFETSIEWDVLLDEVHFYTDLGRLQRPMLIVYNNYGNSYTQTLFEKDRKDTKRSDFKQWIKLTNKHISDLKDGKITIQDLVDMRIVEYISAGEQLNLRLADSYTTLWKNRFNPLCEYTHCDIPISLMGFAALNSPFGTHSPPTKIIHSTNQSKQACGWYSLSWPFRSDKERFLQYRCEIPIVKTISNDYIQPNGMNCIVAIQMYSGYNQEDSIIMNKSAIQRGLFDGLQFTVIKCVLEKNEFFGNPDVSLTDNIKPYASYEKIHKGFPLKGTIINKNDIVIGKYLKYTKPKKDFKYSDKSKIYNSDEPGIVSQIIVSRNEEGKQFAKIKLMIIRNCSVGDKFSMRSGQKGVAGLVMDENDMPFTEDGMVPDIIFNPLSLPKRMTINTLMEILSAKACALKSTVMDATLFRKIDMETIKKELASLGYNPYGRERLYNGMNGKWIDTEIFIGPAYYQRLQKFVNETVYAVSHGSTDAITRQPLEGKSSNGGLRVGEMEKDVLITNGVSRFLSEKFYDNSDGFKVYICATCGKYAVLNHKINLYKCVTCGDNADIQEIDSSWSAKLFRQELRGMNINMTTNLKPYTYEHRR